MGKLLLCLVLLPLAVFGQAGRDARLQKMLQRLEQVSTGSYYICHETYLPSETKPAVSHRFCREYDNPADTTIGAGFLEFDADDTTRFRSGYDGHAHARIDDDKKAILVDDFTVIRRVPFRMVPPPFFCYAKSIVRYALTTADPADIQIADEGEHYFLRLIIDRELQVEFFGKAYLMPGTGNNVWGTRSVYELWVRKSDGLPYKIRREQPHQATVSTLSQITASPNPEAARPLAACYPAGYEIRKYGERRNTQPKFDITGRKAPDWTLEDADGTPVSLADFKNRVLLINFTGIGCGPCRNSIPFLKALKERFPAEDFDLVSIETWGRKGPALRSYAESNGLNYQMLADTSKAFEAYLPDRTVPVFLLLDGNRIVRNVFKGYGKSLDEPITTAIETLLRQNQNDEH